MTGNKNVYIVTGSSRGIGHAIATRLASPDTAIVVTYHTAEQSAKHCCDEIKSKGSECIMVETNLASCEGVHKLVQRTIEEYDHITALVNNAGVRHAAPFENTTEEDVDKVFENDVKSTILLTAGVIPHLVEGGSVVNVSSAVTHRPFADQTVYTAGKGAIEAFTRALAVELAPKRIRVNTVSPGFTDTDMLPETQYEMGEKMSPLGRVGKPDDIAQVVEFLLSPKSAWVTGQNFIASGGFGFAV
ncbi:hypothetical protein HDU67_000149 [Dinochytrium kinnereticum]|nr:hypothetical protein HDU67_000149 [Dinochytrium kinnereticum]